MRRAIVLIIFLFSHQFAIAQNLHDYGTLADEEAFYANVGWSYTGGQLPSVPTGIRTIGSLNIHSSLEADDLWQNIVMYERTSHAQGYSDLAESWAAYYKDTYLSDYNAVDLLPYFGDHTFGWGLLEWATISSDSSYTTAANAIGDALEAEWSDFGTSVKAGFYSLRGPGRILKLAVKLGRTTWANAIWAGLRDSFVWDERTIGGVDVGFWKEDCSAFPWATGCTGAMSSFEIGVLSDGLSDYYELTGDAEVRRRMILLARWSMLYALDSTVNHTGHFIIVDYPSAGEFFHTGVGMGEALDPFYTCTLINVLVRGYLLTGERPMLDKAKYLWDRSSKAVADDAYPYTNRTPDNEVGHFMNAQPLIGNIFYTSEGETPYVRLLFKAWNQATGNWALLANSSLFDVIAANPTVYVYPGSDNYSDHPNNIVKDWNGGTIDTSRQMLVIPTPGGHTSWFYNDVWGFTIAGGWVSLTGGPYLPYVTVDDATNMGILIFPDNSPVTVHSYDGIAYMANTDSIFMKGGPGWNHTGQGPPPRSFSMTTHAWTYGTSQGIETGNGMCSAYNAADNLYWFRTASALYVYNPTTDVYNLALGDGPSPPTYSTCLVIGGFFYQFSGSTVYKFQSGVGYTTLSLTGESLPFIPAPGVAWEPDLDKVVWWGGGQDVYFVDLTTLVVTKQAVPGDDPGASQGLGTYKRFGRIASKTYLLMNSIYGVYRLTLDQASQSATVHASRGRMRR